MAIIGMSLSCCRKSLELKLSLGSGAADSEKGPNFSGDLESLGVLALDSVTHM